MYTPMFNLKCTPWHFFFLERLRNYVRMEICEMALIIIVITPDYCCGRICVWCRPLYGKKKKHQQHGSGPLELCGLLSEAGRGDCGCYLEYKTGCVPKNRSDRTHGGQRWGGGRERFRHLIDEIVTHKKSSRWTPKWRMSLGFFLFDLTFI